MQHIHRHQLTRSRKEWKIHPVGMSLNSRDRFYSCHSATHYAIYHWQPAHNTDDDNPIESLTIWDINTPHPTPSPILHLTRALLAHYTLLQGIHPTLTSLSLDGSNLYATLETHRWLVGPEVPGLLPTETRLHSVRCVGVPFADGPRWEDACTMEGDGEGSFCGRGGVGSLIGIEGEGSKRMAPCWRHEVCLFFELFVFLYSILGVCLKSAFRVPSHFVNSVTIGTF